MVSENKTTRAVSTKISASQVYFATFPWKCDAVKGTDVFSPSAQNSFPLWHSPVWHLPTGGLAWGGVLGSAWVRAKGRCVHAHTHVQTCVCTVRRVQICVTTATVKTQGSSVTSSQIPLIAPFPQSLLPPVAHATTDLISIPTGCLSRMSRKCSHTVYNR